MRPINSTKKYSGIINSSKNKLISKINWQISSMPNAYLIQTKLK